MIQVEQTGRNSFEYSWEREDGELDFLAEIETFVDDNGEKIIILVRRAESDGPVIQLSVL